MEDVINFLKANNFEQQKDDSEHFINNACSVRLEPDHYVVANSNGDTMYSSGLDIYWLIGVLTYYGYIDKNYKQINYLRWK